MVCYIEMGIGVHKVVALQFDIYPPAVFDGRLVLEVHLPVTGVRFANLACEPCMLTPASLD